MEVVKPSSYLVLDGIESKSREIFSDEEISRLFFYANQNEKFSCTAREVLFLVFTGLRPEEFFSIQKEDISLEDCYIFSAGSKTGAGRNRLIPLISQVIHIERVTKHPRGGGEGTGGKRPFPLRGGGGGPDKHPPGGGAFPPPHAPRPPRETGVEGRTGAPAPARPPGAEPKGYPTVGRAFTREGGGAPGGYGPPRAGYAGRPGRGGQGCPYKDDRSRKLQIHQTDLHPREFAPVRGRNQKAGATGTK